MLLARSIAVLLYLVVDILYVLSSKGFYESSVRKISGDAFPAFTMDRKMAAVLAYVALGMGWFYLVAPVIEKTASVMHAVGTAFVYAFAVYGVYNLTLYTIFKNYTWDVVLRDLTWGITALSVLSIAYFWYVQKRMK